MRKDMSTVKYGCYYCKYLDTSHFKELDNGLKQRMYGCNHPTYRDGYVVGWVKKENELKNQGCGGYKEKPKMIKSNEHFMIWQPLEVNNAPMYCLSYLDKFDYNSHILYCPDLEELEREMEKRTNAKNGLVQLSLF